MVPRDLGLDGSGVQRHRRDALLEESSRQFFSMIDLGQLTLKNGSHFKAKLSLPLRSLSWFDQPKKAKTFR